MNLQVPNGTYILLRSLVKVSIYVHSAGSSLQVFVNQLDTGGPSGNVSDYWLRQLEMT